MNAYEKLSLDIFELGQSLADKPELANTYNQRRLEFGKLDRKVKTVLEDHFHQKQFRSLCAILQSIPTGNAAYIFNAWLDELIALGLLKSEIVEELKNENTWS